MGPLRMSISSPFSKALFLGDKIDVTQSNENRSADKLTFIKCVQQKRGLKHEFSVKYED